MANRTTFPFEVPFATVERDMDRYVDAVFSALRSEFMVLPRGAGFIEYSVFEQGYERLKQVTQGFRRFEPQAVKEALFEMPIGFIVLRTMLGFTPPEWGYVASQEGGVEVAQGFVRTLDRRIRMEPLKPLAAKDDSETARRIDALISSVCGLLTRGAPNVEADRIHRLDKADTRRGIQGLQNLADFGVPYAMLLYERFLGRPFAGHRDSVSELIGDVLESAIEATLSKSGISFRKTRRAERIEGFDQAPDFIVPSEFNPQVVIEAKLTEDDGTARDKVTRVQHLGELASAGRGQKKTKFEVVACIAGRGFGVRREDMKKMLRATRGKVFTLQNMDSLVNGTRLREFVTR